MKQLFFILSAAALLAGTFSCRPVHGSGTEDRPLCQVYTGEAGSLAARSARVEGKLFWTALEMPSVQYGFVYAPESVFQQADLTEQGAPSGEAIQSRGGKEVSAGKRDVSGSGEEAFTALFEGLSPNTRYYFCARASYGTTVLYGHSRAFRTTLGAITDIRATDVGAGSVRISFQYTDGVPDGAGVRCRGLHLDDGASADVEAAPVGDGVFAAVITDGIWPFGTYWFRPFVRMGGETLEADDELRVDTPQGILVEEVKVLGPYSAEISVRTGSGTSAPTLYYSNEVYSFSEDYKSGKSQTMTSAGSSLYKTTLTGLTGGTRYWFVAALSDALASEVSSFTTQ